ncbi:zinc-binding alcohol dehydrogenase family protein [Pseudonocardia sp.]|uniref:quinone oxidoreductase family protein n=1 Tax=Pseudonocardia sp. TaxID=60912 RepID=UPI002614FA45|nr:zinc-binding alcohol dehydrogenase family protein [Pseudonocardia sp.]
MRAAVLETPGTAPVLREVKPPLLERVELPYEPRGRESHSSEVGPVLIRVAAAPITPLDRFCATGTSYFGSPAVPYVPGVQGVGTDPHGRPVWFATSAGMAPGDGSMREQATVTAEDVVPLPAGADPVLVAALGLSAVAAWCALTATGRLAAGETVVVLGAGGVVGQAGVQLARLAGAGRVVAVARSTAAREQALALGADAAVAIEPGDDPGTLGDRLAAAAGPADLVLDPLYGVPAAAAARTLRPGGRLVHLGSAAGDTTPLDSATLRSRSLQVLGYTNNALSTAERRDALVRVVDEAVAGRLTVTHTRAPLSAVTEVWDAPGRVVLEI